MGLFGDFLTFAEAVKRYPREFDSDSQFASKINSRFTLQAYQNSLDADPKFKSQAEYFRDVSQFVYKFYMYWHTPKISIESSEEEREEYLKWLSGLPLVSRPLGLRLNVQVGVKAFKLTVEHWGNILALLGASILIPRIDKNGNLIIAPSPSRLDHVSDFLAFSRWALENIKIGKDGEEIYQRIFEYCITNKLTTKTKIEVAYKKFEKWCQLGFF